MSLCKFLPSLVQVNAWVGIESLKLGGLKSSSLAILWGSLFVFCFVQTVLSCADQSAVNSK